MELEDLQTFVLFTAGSMQKHFKSDIMVAKRRTFKTLTNVQKYVVIYRSFHFYIKPCEIFEVFVH